MAKEKEISISSLCRDLICEGLEILEDRYFDKIASERENKYNWNKSLTHKEVWNKS
mgnify:CR=1 FL=1